MIIGMLFFCFKKKKEGKEKRKRSKPTESKVVAFYKQIPPPSQTATLLPLSFPSLSSLSDHRTNTLPASISTAMLSPSPPASSPLPSSSSAPRKRAKTGPSPSQSKWRTSAQQRVYGRRLIDALRATGSGARGGGGGGEGGTGAAAVGPRAVKEAADSALAMTAHGQTRWSRAILFGRPRRKQLLLKAGGKLHRRRRPRPRPYAAAVALPAADDDEEGEDESGGGVLKETKVRDRLRKLGRLVPGCRKLSAPSLLEETADYVAALEMQVRTMRALADALSAVRVSAADPAAR